MFYKRFAGHNQRGAFVLLVLIVLTPGMVTAQGSLDQTNQASPRSGRSASSSPDERVKTLRNTPEITIHTTTKLVLVDVVVNGRNGEHLKGLTAANFSVTEDLKKQKVVNFSYTDLSESNIDARKSLPQLPPNVFTNRPSYSASPGEIAVILIDALNTESKDQSYSRLQLLEYLATQLKPGQEVAVYTLGRSLKLLQGFTSDSDVLRASVQSFLPNESRELGMSNVEKDLPPPSRIGGGVRMLQMLQRFYAEQEKFSLNARVSQTLSALREIARSVAGYAGRKSIVWVTGSFPLN